jgi:hypothetical protein
MDDINLDPILNKDMAIFFVALNPPPVSNSIGHFFSQRRDFWDLLYESGVITERIDDLMTADEIVFRDTRINYKNLAYGISDLVRIIERDSRKVKPKLADFDRVLGYIREYTPRIVCLMHGKVRQAFLRQQIISERPRYGRVGEYNGSTLYCVPFPAGTSIKKEIIVGHYKELLKLL